MTRSTTEPLTVTEAQADTLETVLARFQTLPDQMACEAFHEETLVFTIAGMFIGIEPDGYAHS